MLWMKEYQTSKNSHQKQAVLCSGGKQNDFSQLSYELENDFLNYQSVIYHSD